MKKKKEWGVERFSIQQIIREDQFSFYPITFEVILINAISLILSSQ